MDDAGPCRGPGRSPPLPTSGPPCRLTAEHLVRIPALLQRGPAAYGFRGEFWTRTRIAAIIRIEFGVSYHPRHVGCLLDALHWSLQKPTRRARQRNEAAIAQWRDDTWLAIKRGRRRKIKRSSS